MFYDYYGFPDEAYKIVYPAPGNPELADRIAVLLNQNSIKAHIDPQRGFDHGLFIPLHLMYPEAKIPALQLSLLKGLDPTAHLALGKGLRELLSEHILWAFRDYDTQLERNCELKGFDFQLHLSFHLSK